MLFSRDSWQEIYTVLARNKLRTVLTAFGVFWGIFMMVIMLGSAQGLSNGAMAGFSGSARNSVFMWTQTTSKAYKGFNARRRIEMDMSDAEAIRKEIPEVEYLSPRCQAGGYRGADNVTRGTRTGAFSIYGDTPEYQYIEKVDILAGRYLNPTDLAENRKVAFIGKEVYNALYEPGEEAIGSYLKAQGINYKVVGVFASSSSNSESAERQEKAILIPISTFQRAYNWGNTIGWLSFTAYPQFSAVTVEEKVKELLKSRLQVHPDDERALGSFNLQEEFKKFSALLSGIRLLSMIVGTLTLLAGAVGVSNIMVVTVKERTRELGIRRALGATPAMVMAQVITEALVLTLVAGMLGVIVGVWLLELVSGLMQSMGGDAAYFRNPGVDLPTVAVALAILVVVGLLAGLIPARKAVRIKPVDALRYE